jgi:Protein of unknown function (DUF1329)
VTNHLLKPIFVVTLLLSLSSLANITLAKSSKEQAQKLNSTLTPVGAERAGNSDGAIPAWTGGITEPPVGFSPGMHHPDPYAADEVLLTIDAENMAQYAQKLPEGAQALLKKYPQTFKINVYPTRRSYAAPQWVYNNTYNNALSAELVDGGNGVKGAFGGIPFPIPSSGQEAIWNHLLRFRGSQRVQNEHWIHVYPSGKRIEESALSYFRFPYYQKDLNESTYGGDIMQFDVQWTSPSRKKGERLMIREAVDQVDSPRQAWRYLPGARRVKRAPTFAYDTPIGPQGSRTMDDTHIFNGAIDRYNWELLGKKEMVIPYNIYKLESQVSFDEILHPYHLNPEYVRWELHRIWLVRATLKEGARHIYAERTFYLDEDSWAAAMIDVKDGRGAMWRVTMAGLKNYYDVLMMDSKSVVYHDLQSQAYQAAGFHNEDEEFMDLTESALKPDDYYKPAALRRRAKR